MYFPGSVVILCDDHFGLSTIQSLDGPWADFDLRLFYPSAAHIPTIVVIGLEPEKSSSLGAEPCDPMLSFFARSVTQAKHLYLLASHQRFDLQSPTEASKYLEVVPWLAFDGTYYWEQKVTRCPFTLGTAANELCKAE